MGREREKTLRIKNIYCIFFYFHEELLMDEGERERERGENEKRQIGERERERERRRGERERENKLRMGGQAADG